MTIVTKLKPVLGLGVLLGALLSLPGSAVLGQEVPGDQAVVAVEMGKTDDLGTAFTLYALKDCEIFLSPVTGWDNGQVLLGEEQERRALKKGEIYRFHTMVSENLPGVCVTAEYAMGADLWCPAISGNDGSLVLTPGFRLR